MAGLPPIEMLSTPQVVARLLQMKTHMHIRTNFKMAPSSHSSHSSPVPSPPTSGFKAKGEVAGRGRTVLKGKVLPIPTPCWALRALSRPGSSGDLGVRPERGGTSGHPAPHYSFTPGCGTINNPLCSPVLPGCALWVSAAVSTSSPTLMRGLIISQGKRRKGGGGGETGRAASSPPCLSSWEAGGYSPQLIFQ